MENVLLLIINFLMRKIHSFHTNIEKLHIDDRFPPSQTEFYEIFIKYIQKIGLLLSPEEFACLLPKLHLPECLRDTRVQYSRLPSGDLESTTRREDF